ncbi:MAG: general secretion pathway protein GspF [Gammaproteobacteria bacterium]|nr:general secretion pathway protein GspF [Gammaproteobacteria bacterium]
MIKRPHTPEAYIDLVKQALFEIDELRAAIEYDSEGMQDSIAFVDDLERAVRQVYNSMADGSYHFQDKDLPFMEIVRQQGVFSLPFRDLLNLINDTHRKGLDVQGED